ncbi:MAG: alpha/beta hydrolase, partial [Mesorhizobium sp.]
MASDESFSDFFYPAADGLKLHTRIYGERNADA